MAGRVEGKVAVVTGGGSGIGAATAELLASEGAAVVVADLVGERAAATVERIVAARGRAVATTTDVSDEAQVVAMVETAVQEFGRLDTLHNNAALVAPDQFALDRGIVDMPVDTWDRIMGVNLRGVMLGCKHAIPHMIRGGGGSIINMSSGSSRLGDFQRTAYGASKSGVNALSSYVATQHGRHRIRVNTILPGLILTPAAHDNLPADRKDILADNVLVPYFGEPIDVAYLVLFLASDESRYITGQLFPIDGGMSCHQPTYAQFKDLEES